MVFLSVFVLCPRLFSCSHCCLNYFCLLFLTFVSFFLFLFFLPCLFSTLFHQTQLKSVVLCFLCFCVFVYTFFCLLYLTDAICIYYIAQQCIVLTYFFVHIIFNLYILFVICLIVILFFLYINGRE